VLVDAAGQVVQTGSTLDVAGPIEAGKTVGVDAGLAAFGTQLQSVRIRIDAAQLAP
jgi:hypothetical protein